MLNIYFGRESINKEKFIFDNICGKTLLLVPDQFTLAAEQRAFSILRVKGLMDLEIISFSRLGFRTLEALGGNKVTHIDKYGRHMILTKIISEESKRLEIFNGLEKKISFVEMINNLISEMKQFNTNPMELKRIAEKIDDNILLQKKLQDIQLIYEKYEEYIKDKYVDTEDYVNLFISKMENYDEIKKSNIWIWGFDYFTPKNFDVIRQLIKYSPQVNIVMTFDEGSRDEEIFKITGNMIKRLSYICDEEKVDFKKIKIGTNYEFKGSGNAGDKTKAIMDMEKELFSIPIRKSETFEGITLVSAANLYSEVESAAAYILKLVRDEGLRYRDIGLICNDMEIRGSIVRRTFEEHQIPLFIDGKRNIMHNPVMEYIASLVDIVCKGWNTGDVLRHAKTGLSGITIEEVEQLENYTIKYKIRGNLWTKEFEKGILEYGEAGLLKLNKIRRELVDTIYLFQTDFKNGKRVGEKTKSIYEYLAQKIYLPEKIEKLIYIQNETGKFELAEETDQLWDIICGILQQLTELLGDEEIADKEFSKTLNSGFEAIEIGVIPPTIDKVMMGTMQRTRSSGLKALIVIGANDGLLPRESVSEGILSEDEKEKLYHKEIEICKIDNLRIKEEKLAIYKTLSAVEKYIWISYSTSDEEGKDQKPSHIFNLLGKVFPKIKVENDIVSRNIPMDLINSKSNAIRYATYAIRNGLEGTPIEDEWEKTIRWYKEMEPDQIERVSKAIFYNSKIGNLSKNVTEKLFKRDMEDNLKLSPSSIEKYGRCPFAFFIQYGLRPEERRIYEVAAREIGDIYHNCLMKMSKLLSEETREITSENSLWMKISEEECCQIVSNIVEEETLNYREGLLNLGKSELYKKERIKKVCSQVAWILIQQVREGNVINVEFEAEFGKGDGKIFPPIQVTAAGQTVVIEGKIDRVDVLKNNQVKVIDYKSGKEVFNIDEAKAGYRLQLMLYLEAAQNGIEKEAVGGGVFYFKIEEPMPDVTQYEKSKIEENALKEAARSFKLDGIMLDDPQVIKSIAGEFTGFSNIFSIKSTKEGISGTSKNKLLSHEEFSQLRKAVDEKLVELCTQLIKGNMEARPKKSKTSTSCDYCDFKGVCGFDISLEGCTYERI